MEHSRPDGEGPASSEAQWHRRWRGGGLGRLVLVDTADLDGDGQLEIVTVAGRYLKIYDWTGATYELRADVTLANEGISLAAGTLTDQGPAAIAIGAKDGAMLFVVTSPGVHPMCETLVYPNAFFRSISLADVNGDGRAEIVAAASGAQTLYVFQVLSAGGEARLEELGRVYIGGLANAQGIPSGEMITGTKDGYVDVFVPCSLLPHPTQAFYVVKRGDSLWGVARRFGVSPGAIARTNRLHEPYQLAAGQVLVIPPPKGQGQGHRTPPSETRPDPPPGPRSRPSGPVPRGQVPTRPDADQAGDPTTPDAKAATPDPNAIEAPDAHPGDPPAPS